MNHSSDCRFLRDFVVSQGELFMQVQLGKYFVDSPNTEALIPVFFFEVARRPSPLWRGFLSQRVALAESSPDNVISTKYTARFAVSYLLKGIFNGLIVDIFFPGAPTQYHNQILFTPAIVRLFHIIRLLCSL